ncbi:8169_t:CDS:10 [Paraglomus brasilianum]|uniref:8169_t:CDS:1 n=1 Tax=Paraglomus brasilianum TaxID=144538 RepID=A0A9N9GGU5_9GLOM|nr:8169_t:CDS:10 [Paraglomus brasilianum]
MEQFNPMSNPTDVPRSRNTNPPPAEPASWQIPPSALQPKKRTEKLDKSESRIAVNPYDTEAWLMLLSEVMARGDVERVRETFERFLKLFPSSARHWIQFVEFELKNNCLDRAEDIFRRCLRPTPSVELWKYYLNYVRRKTTGDKSSSLTPEAREVLTKTYEFVLNHVGLDKDSGNIWSDYLFFLKTGEANSTWEESQKMDLMRRTYQKAICIPINNVEHIWKDYDQFENGLNKITAKKFLHERSASYMTARTALRELREITDSINKSILPVPPKWTKVELQQLDHWKRWIAWEKSNPLALEDKSALAQRITFVYRQAMLYMRYYPEIWYDAASYWVEIGKEDEAVTMLKNGMEIMPTSFLLHFYYTELQEQRQKSAEARSAFESLISHLNSEIERIEESAEEAIANVNKAGEAAKEEFSGMELDGHKRRSASILESTKDPLLSVPSICRIRKDQSVAVKVFELGLRSFGDNPEYVAQYLDFLVQLNDDNNTHALFERSLLALPIEKSKIIWDKFGDYVTNYSDLASMRRLDQRRAEKYPDETDIERFASRYSYLDVNIIMKQEVGGKPSSSLNVKKRFQPPLLSSPPTTPPSTHMEDEGTSRRALLDSVNPEKYPRPDFRQWVAYKPTAEQLRRPYFPQPQTSNVPPGVAGQSLGPQPPGGGVGAGGVSVSNMSISGLPASGAPPSNVMSQGMGLPPNVQGIPGTTGAAPAQQIQQLTPVVLKRATNGMLLPEAIVNFLNILPPASVFNGPTLNPIDLIDVIHNSSIPLPPSTALPGQPALPLPTSQLVTPSHNIASHALAPPSHMSSSHGMQTTHRVSPPVREGRYEGNVTGVGGRYGEGRVYERGEGGRGAGGQRGNRGEFFGKQMRNNQQSSRGRGGVDGAPPSYGPSGSKRRRRDFDAEDEFSGGRGGEWGAGGGRGDTEFKRRQGN